MIWTVYRCSECLKIYVNKRDASRHEHADKVREARAEVTWRILEDDDDEEDSRPDRPAEAEPETPKEIPLGSDAERTVVRNVWRTLPLPAYGRTMEPTNALRVLFKAAFAKLRNAAPRGGRSRSLDVVTESGIRTMRTSQYARDMGRRLVQLLHEFIVDATEHAGRIPDMRVETFRWAHDFKREFFRAEFEKSGYSYGDLVRMACERKRTYWNAVRGDARDAVTNSLRDIVDVVTCSS